MLFTNYTSTIDMCSGTTDRLMLEEKIKAQVAENTRLYKIFEYKMYLDEMQPLIDEWRAGSKKVREMTAELNASRPIRTGATAESKTFVNGWGEATSREIKTAAYTRAQTKLSNEIMRFVGGQK